MKLRKINDFSYSSICGVCFDNTFKGSPCTDNNRFKEIKQIWKEYRQILYNRDVNNQSTIQDILSLKEPLVVENEVRPALWLLPNQKDTRTDGIPIEIWQAIEEE